MAGSRKTRGRLSPFACGHRGFGVECHRCGQANELETRANELAQIVKNQGKALPAYVSATEASVLVRAGGQRVEVQLTGKLTVLGAVGSCVQYMREHATRLQKAENPV
jgi:hypothetical protein